MTGGSYLPSRLFFYIIIYYLLFLFINYSVFALKSSTIILIYIFFKLKKIKHAYLLLFFQKMSQKEF